MRRHGSPEGRLLQHPRHTSRSRARRELRWNKLFEKSLPAAEPNLSCQSGARLPALVFSAIDLLDCRNIKNLKLLVLITTSWRLHHSMCLAVLRGRLAPSLALAAIEHQFTALPLSAFSPSSLAFLNVPFLQRQVFWGERGGAVK